MDQRELKPMIKKIDDDKKEKSSEEKQYLICIKGKESEDVWEIVTGRTEAYEFIKNMIDFIVFEESFILVETVKLSERKSIYAFMKYAERFYNDNFDIEDYIKGDWSEDEYKEMNGIDPMFLDSKRLDTIGFMNGEINSEDIK